MAIKINELINTIGSGARSNKYRVLMPFMGREFDIMCHEATTPGRSLGTVDIVLRGREYKVAGDRADENTIQLTFYNDPHLATRNFFLRYIEAIQSFATPVSVSQTQLLKSQGKLNAYQTIQNSLNTLKGYVTEVKHNLGSLLSLGGFEFFGTGAWYQMEMTIQQLDENENIATQTVLHNAWISEVSEIQYTDDTGEITKTTLTIVYTGSTIL